MEILLLWSSCQRVNGWLPVTSCWKMLKMTQVILFGQCQNSPLFNSPVKIFNTFFKIILGDILDDEAKMEKEKAKAKKVEREPTGRVVGIIRRKWRQYCGILQPSQDQNVCKFPLKKSNLNLVYKFSLCFMCCIFFFQSVRHLFVPAERKIPKIRIETRQAEKLKSQRIIVAIDAWPRTSRYPMVYLIYLLFKPLPVFA